MRQSGGDTADYGRFAGPRDARGDFLNAVPRAGRTVCGAAFGNGPAAALYFVQLCAFFFQIFVFPLAKIPKKSYNEENQSYGIMRGTGGACARPASGAVCQINWKRKEYHL